jgi:hypothetical protein
MLKRLFTLRKEVIDALLAHGHEVPLCDDDWATISQLLVLLRPIADIVRTFEGEKYPTLSLVWPYLIQLKRFLEGDTTDPLLPAWNNAALYGSVVNAVRKSLVSEIAKRDGWTVTPLMRLTTVLDPDSKPCGFLALASKWSTKKPTSWWLVVPLNSSLLPLQLRLHRLRHLRSSASFPRSKEYKGSEGPRLSQMKQLDSSTSLPMLTLILWSGGRNTSLGFQLWPRWLSGTCVFLLLLPPVKESSRR